MYKLIESADYDTLFAAYLADHDHYSGGVFSEYDLIISTLPEGDILLQKLADARGIASGVRPRYWTSFYWRLVEHITGYTPRGEQTPLNNTAIRWHLYTYLYRHGDTILADPAHPLHPHLHQHWPDATRLTADMTRRLWHYSGQLANLYSHYLNQRPDWLDAWQHDPPPALDDLLQGDGLKHQPAWLAGHYREHYQQQYRLWHATLATTYAARAERIRTFWHKLAHDDAARDKLPPYIPLYAPTNLTETTLRTLIRLGEYSEVRLYHLTAADGEYSDIVDSRWLRRLKLRDPARAEAQHYDHGNTLLSRYGKQQRDRARLLHAYSTDDNTTQHDAPAITVSNLLSAVQADIRSQNETHTAAAPHDAHDDSLRIHACHGTLRQAETLRGDIIAWLNADPTRRLSDILILLPDPIAEQSVLRAVFPGSGDYDGYRLPARIVGTPDTGTTSLWHSLAGHYTHLNGRYDAPTITDWLHNDDTAQSLGSDHEHIQRITTALIQAGYKRGFDSEHLQQTLHPDDHDHRYTYTYALDRLIAGVLMPDSDDDNRDTIPLPGLSLADLPVLEALAKHANRSRELRRKLAAHTPAQTWLADIRDTLHRDYQHAHDSTAWQTLNHALTSLEQQLSAHRDLAPQNEQLYLPLPFILDNIETHLSAQQNSREPSGVITIGGLTGLRNLPYKLIAFMNADHDRYPARQNDERYNLIDLDRPRPGDRNREQEDLAALLDSISRAGEAYWIYYNAAEPGDNEPRLPASPIQELLQYLDEQRAKAPRHYHITHPATPFEPDPAETRPAPLWHNVRQTLARPPCPALPFLTLCHAPLPAANPADPETLPLDQLIRDTLRSASTYARAHNISHDNHDDTPAAREPLAASALDNYHINDTINRALEEGRDPAARLARLPLLPAGISGNILLAQRLAENQAHYRALLAQSGCTTPPPLAEHTLDLGDTLLTARLPTSGNTWPRLSARRQKAKHQYRYWLEHLAWNARGTGGDSHIHYADGDEQLRALPAEDAAEQLRTWLAVRRSAQQQLWLAPIELMPAYLDNLGKKDGADKNRLLIHQWIDDDQNKADSGELWRHLWRGNEAILADHIAAALATYAPLLQPWLGHRA
ncbi:exodeoxyribonuclease V subunit gamma [Cardiobacterium valvarum]|uniref:Putative exodeoxyribonuclease V, gamma subunit n=1 Tax=Cardiobacterium valvarum F0432 TaxID=797473 RepID=G9ZB97_9GAMM|nr:exodeoxyribonuclease V subunit gamma [Cardiobacterium valvarum]EHM56171.1 putative exodeoxyribonuclease V, gamma subunit [Cardiobacterium valvarum F0432]